MIRSEALRNRLTAVGCELHRGSKSRCTGWIVGRVYDPSWTGFFDNLNEVEALTLWLEQLASLAGGAEV